jgi:uncharacterized membrane protein
VINTIFALRWLHVIGSAVLLGTGAGIAFFMVMAHRTRDPVLIAHTASVVVVADYLFTATAVVVQPITGALLVQAVGWGWAHSWIWASIILYVVTGALWLPVVWMQLRMRDLARAAAHNSTPLPRQYFTLFHWWFAFGIPAFLAVLAIIWLMLAKPPMAFFD